jgi:hypothetical protein
MPVIARCEFARPQDRYFMQSPTAALATWTEEEAAFLRAELARLEGRTIPSPWGLPLHCLPRFYLEWTIRTLDLSPTLRAAIIDILARPDPWSRYRPAIRRWPR